MAAVLCYLLGIISGIILLRVERENRFVRFHALQSILYSALAIVLFCALAIAGLWVLSELVGLASLVVWFYLLIRAARGDWFQLPGVGWWAERNA